MRRFLTLFVVILLSLASLTYAQAPVPFINLPLVPDAVAPGGNDFTLTVNGTGFVSNSVVNWNGIPLATQFVSQSQLTATVPAADIATASTGWVTVVSPPPGGGKSNTEYLGVTMFVGKPEALAPPSSYWLEGTAPANGAVGDFNGDGKLDLAVFDSGQNIVSILLGDGSGGFTTGPVITAGNGSIISMAMGDFNRDGILDLAFANSDNNVYVLLGDGTGNFTLASTTPAGGSITFLVAGDFNGDGNLDLVVGAVWNSYGDREVTTLLGDGTGHFKAGGGCQWCFGNLGNSFVVGDFNGDGKLDLAYDSNDTPTTVGVLLGDGKGDFTDGWSSGNNCCAGGGAIAAGDLNGDGILDLAIINNWSTNISVMLGDGNGGFTLASTLTISRNFAMSSIVAGEFNADGKLDLAVGSWYGLYVFLGDGTGNFKQDPLPGIWGGNPAMGEGDFNGDGLTDLASFGFQSVSLLLGLPPSGVVGLSPSSLSFSVQLIGTGSNPQQVTLTNMGNHTLGITSVATSTNFSQTNNCPHKLAAGGQCTANVVFTPRDINTITGVMTITDNAFNSPQTVQLSGIGIAVTLLPTSLDFGDQPIGSSSPPQIVTLTNYAPKPVTLYDARIVGPRATSFSQTNTCARLLPPGGTCVISVTFTPETEGSKSATLEVNDNGGPGPQTVALAGTGVVGTPIVKLSPNSINFGQQLLGTTSGPQYVTLSNTAYLTLDIASIVISGYFAQTNNCPSSLPGDQSCTITVTFSPQQVNETRGRITITDNAPDSPQIVALGGAGTWLSVQPSSLNFGSQKKGTSSPPQNVTLTNQAQHMVVMAGARIVGGAAGSYSKIDNCPKKLAPAESCTISVVFKPHYAGTLNATLEMYDNGGGSPQTVALTGNGTHH